MRNKLFLGILLASSIIISGCAPSQATPLALPLVLSDDSSGATCTSYSEHLPDAIKDGWTHVEVTGLDKDTLVYNYNNHEPASDYKPAHVYVAFKDHDMVLIFVGDNDCILVVDDLDVDNLRILLGSPA